MKKYVKISIIFTLLCVLQIRLVAQESYFQNEEIYQCPPKYYSVGFEDYSMPDSIGRNKLVKDVTFHEVNFINFSDSIFSLPNVEEFILIKCTGVDPKQIVDGLKKFKKLKVLTLIGLELDSLLFDICEIQSIERLVLRNSDISKIPENISKLSKLRSLHINNCKLTKFDSALMHNDSLLNIDLSQNYIVEIEVSINDFYNLEGLNLKLNRIENISPLFKKSRRINGNFRRLYLSHNKIENCFITKNNFPFMEKFELFENPLSIESKRHLSKEFSSSLKSK
jgi:Leucine-rich repeat (LRR) protein